MRGSCVFLLVAAASSRQQDRARATDAILPDLDRELDGLRDELAATGNSRFGRLVSKVADLKRNVHRRIAAASSLERERRTDDHFLELTKKLVSRVEMLSLQGQTFHEGAVILEVSESDATKPCDGVTGCLPDDLVPTPRDGNGASCLSPMSTGNTGFLDGEQIPGRWTDRDGSNWAPNTNSHQEKFETPKLGKESPYHTTRGVAFNFAEEDDTDGDLQFGGGGVGGDMRVMSTALAFQFESQEYTDPKHRDVPPKRFLYIKYESASVSGFVETMAHSVDYIRTRCIKLFGTGDCTKTATKEKPAPCPMQGLEKNGRKEKYYGVLGKSEPGSVERRAFCADPDKYLGIPEFRTHWNPEDASGFNTQVQRLKWDAQLQYCIWHRKGCEVYIPLVEQGLLSGHPWVTEILNPPEP